MDHCSHLGQTPATTGHPLLPVLRNPSTDDDNSDDDDDDDDDDDIIYTLYSVTISIDYPPPHVYEAFWVY